MISPSIRTLRFQSPCVMGCWGPMLTHISDIPALHLQLFGLVELERPKERVEGVPVGGEQTPQVGMMVEDDTDQLVRLALVPVRRRPDPRRALDVGVGPRHVGREQDVLAARVAPGDVEHLPVVYPIDRADHGKVPVVKVVPDDLEQLERRGALEADAARHPVERLDTEQLGAEGRPEALLKFLRLHVPLPIRWARDPAYSPRSRMSVSSVRIPSSIASGLGGQPAM